MQINDIAHLAAKGGAQKSENGFPVAGPNGSIQHEEVKEAKSTEPLRSISLQNPTYNKKEMKETALDRFTEDEASGLSAADIKEQMVLNAENMTPGEQGNLQKDGYNPMEMDKDDYVTIADKIRVSLAKGGMDISVTGGLSEGKLETLGE
ncbi:MAG: hypothetical protein K5853_05220, partial [Lachnospiraceae bacterium]|nr:hypothetical protein [Lachnospiraceae bacterium]